MTLQRTMTTPVAAQAPAAAAAAAPLQTRRPPAAAGGLDRLREPGTDPDLTLKLDKFLTLAPNLP